jgi:hypothetical protein
VEVKKVTTTTATATLLEQAAAYYWVVIVVMAVATRLVRVVFCRSAIYALSGITGDIWCIVLFHVQLIWWRGWGIYHINNNAQIMLAATSEWRTNQHHYACSYQQMENKSISQFTKFISMIHATIKLFGIAAHCESLLA